MRFKDTRNNLTYTFVGYYDNFKWVRMKNTKKVTKLIATDIFDKYFVLI